MRQLIAGLVVAVAGFTAAADDKAEKPVPKLAGTWVRDADGFELKFQFLPKGEAKITVMAAENGVVVSAKADQDKDGTVRVEVTGSEEKGTFPVKPPKGSKFSFKFKVDGKTATVTDYEGDHAEEARNVIEGKYKQAEDEKK